MKKKYISFLIIAGIIILLLSIFFIQKIEVTLLKPTDNGNNVPIKPTLEWGVKLKYNTDLTYEVYLGDSIDNMKLIATTNSTSITLDEALDFSKKYYWYVKIFMDGLHIKTSKIYSFNIISPKIYPQPDGELTYNIILLSDSWKEFFKLNHLNKLKEYKEKNIEFETDPLILSSIYFGEDESNLRLVDNDTPTHYYVIKENLEVGKKYYWKYVYKDPQTKEIIYESEIHTFTVSEDYKYLNDIFSRIENIGFIKQLPFIPSVDRKKEIINFFEDILNEIGNYYLAKSKDINYVYNKIKDFTNLIKSSYYSSQYYSFSEIFRENGGFDNFDRAYSELINREIKDITLTKKDDNIVFVTFFGFWLNIYDVYEVIDLRYFININKNKFIAKKIYDKDFSVLYEDQYYPFDDYLGIIKINITDDGLDDYIFYVANTYRYLWHKLYAIFSYNNDYKVFFLTGIDDYFIENNSLEIKVKNINDNQFELYVPDGLHLPYMSTSEVGPIYYRVYTYNEKKNKMEYKGYDIYNSEENMKYFFNLLLEHPKEVEKVLNDKIDNILTKIFPYQKYELSWERNEYEEFDLYVSFDNYPFFKVNNKKIKDNKYILSVPLFVKNLRWKIRAYLDNGAFIESDIQYINTSNTPPNIYAK